MTLRFPFCFGRGSGTVGAVAVDSEGNVACATSTGGMTNKMIGRVGDTPLIGELKPHGLNWPLPRKFSKRDWIFSFICIITD